MCTILLMCCISAIEDEIEYEDVGDLRDYNAVMRDIFGVDEPRKFEICRCIC